MIVQTKDEFVAYLEETLIPDLIESGRVSTAADFNAAIFFMTGAQEVGIDNDAPERPRVVQIS